MLARQAAAGGISAADRALRREDFRLLVGDIRALPESQSSALVLHEMHGLSYEEVAVAMSTTVSSVKSLLVRARVSLVEAGEARELPCTDARLELAEHAQGMRGPVRAHLKRCDDCRVFNRKLEKTGSALAALAPVWPSMTLKGLVLAKLGSAGGGAASGTGATAGVSAGAAVAVKSAVGLMTVAALVTAGADPERTARGSPAPKRRPR